MTTAEVPRYREIERVLRARIAMLRPGDPLPSDAELCDEFGLKDQFWIQGYNFEAGHEWEPVRAIQIALEHGMTNLAIWAYRACEPLSNLWPADIEKTWSTIVRALRQVKAGEPVELPG